MEAALVDEAALRQAVEDANDEAERLLDSAPTPFDLLQDKWALERAILEAEVLSELQRLRRSVTLKCVVPARLRSVLEAIVWAYPKHVQRRLPDEDFEVVAPIDLEPEQPAPERPPTGSRWKETTTTVFTPYNPNLPEG